MGHVVHHAAAAAGQPHARPMRVAPPLTPPWGVSSARLRPPRSAVQAPRGNGARPPLAGVPAAGQALRHLPGPLPPRQCWPAPSCRRPARAPRPSARSRQRPAAAWARARTGRAARPSRAPRWRRTAAPRPRSRSTSAAPPASPPRHRPTPPRPSTGTAPARTCRRRTAARPPLRRAAGSAGSAAARRSCASAPRTGRW